MEIFIPPQYTFSLPSCPPTPPNFSLPFSLLPGYRDTSPLNIRWASFWRFDRNAHSPGYFTISRWRKQRPRQRQRSFRSNEIARMRGWGRGWLISTVVRLFARRYRLSSTVGTPGNWERGNLGGEERRERRHPFARWSRRSWMIRYNDGKINYRERAITAAAFSTDLRLSEK